MALLTNNTTVAIGIQTAADTFDDPGSNYLNVSQCRMSIEGVTADNDEYTGSPFKNAPTVSGKRGSLSYNVKIRGPGGSDVPAANAFLPGLILQAAKFSEVRTTAAVPTSPEAGSSGSTTTFTLGAGAMGTADLYKSKAISLASMGSSYSERMTAIIAYTAGKVATFAETFGGTVNGNYQIPKQLGYVWNPDSSDPILISQVLWLDGHRFDLMNCRLTSFQIVVPTSTKEQTTYPELQVTWSFDIDGDSEEATPAIAAAGAIPTFKDGDCWLNKVEIGTQTFTLDMSIQTEYPPNPNKTDGVDAAELVGGTARLSMTRQKYLPSVIDPLALADAQSYHPFWAQWGNAAGKMVQIVVTDARLNYANPEMGGNIIMENQELMIDPAQKCIAINFPY